MTKTMSNNKRIARNTLLLYLRMGITMAVQLYTSRIVLDALGVDDYGIYNIVGSVIVMFTFVSWPLTAAIQRFFSYELGKTGDSDINKVFNISLVAFLILTLLVTAAVEIGGSWYVTHKLNVPPGRLEAAFWVFHASTVSMAFMLMRTPFESLIISYEKMDFYAYISIAEVILKLANALSLVYFTIDKLCLFAFNQLVITAIVTGCFAFFCLRKLPDISIRRVWDSKLFKSIVSFSGWSLLSAIAAMTATSGVNVLLNTFFGVAVNSAMGIAVQVSNAINRFATNFQTAFNPQIVKYYSSGEFGQMQTLSYRAAKISYLLLFMIICPLLYNLDFVLNVWLKEVPPYTGPLCVGLIVWILLESLMTPLHTSVTATGEVKSFYITLSIVTTFVILLSWACLYAGYSPVSVVVVKCVVNVAILIVRLLYARRLTGYSIRKFISRVISPVIAVTVIMTVVMGTLSVFGTEGWSKLILYYLVSTAVFIPVAFFIALSSEERASMTLLIKRKLQIS